MLDVLQCSKASTETVLRFSVGYKEAARKVVCFIFLHRYAVKENIFLRQVLTLDDS